MMETSPHSTGLRLALVVGVLLVLAAPPVSGRGTRSKFQMDSAHQDVAKSETHRQQRLFSLFSVVTFPVRQSISNERFYFTSAQLKNVLNPKYLASMADTLTAVLFLSRTTLARHQRTTPKPELASPQGSACPHPARPMEIVQLVSHIYPHQHCHRFKWKIPK